MTTRRVFQQARDLHETALHHAPDHAYHLPTGVLQLNLLSLGWALTPERAALIRRLDQRPFPFFAVYAVEEDIVAGQVGVYRLPMISTQGPEDVGGICAVCTHPAFSQRGIATRLMDEAHSRMRAAGLRFSTLGTARHRGAYAAYRRQGYEDVVISGATFARYENVRRESRLRAERTGADRLSLADAVFRRVAAGRLGFARRHEPFIPMLAAISEVEVEDIWLLWNSDELVGYALARVSEMVLTVSDLLLTEGVDAADAVAALARELTITYLKVRVNRPSEAASLRQAGYPSPRPDWSTFMIKPLTPDVTADDARRLFGIGTEQCLISSIDVT